MVNTICNVTGPEQIYVSDLVHDLGIDKRFSFDHGRTESLKGFSEPTKICQPLGSAPAELSPPG